MSSVATRIGGESRSGHRMEASSMGMRCGSVRSCTHISNAASRSARVADISPDLLAPAA